jgi:hypothetical protein
MVSQTSKQVQPVRLGGHTHLQTTSTAAASILGFDDLQLVDQLTGTVDGGGNTFAGPTLLYGAAGK